MACAEVPLDPLGIELRGLDLGGELPEDDFQLLRQTVLTHGLVLLRDQSLDDAGQIALGRRLGPLEALANTPDGDMKPLIVISNLDVRGRPLTDADDTMSSVALNEQWHTDSSFRETPATYSIFRAVVVPPEGGETWYASLTRAYQELDPATRNQLEGLRAVHDYREAYRKAGSKTTYEDRALEGRHPLIRRHPETGARGLYLSGHCVSIEGMEPAAGRALLEELLDFCTDERRVYRHRWREGDVMLWDNRCMIHRAPSFDPRHPRVMHHVRVAGTEKVVS